MAIDVKSEVEKIEREVRDRLYTVTIQQWLVDRILAIVADAKREQMEADCKAVSAYCARRDCGLPTDTQGFRSFLIGVLKEIRTAFAATEPTAHEEVCWLIERGQQEGQSPPAWWAGDGSGTCLAWSFDANKAIKYPTKAAAEAALDSISGIKGVHSPMGHVTEHAFVDPSATEPRDTGKDAARELGLDGAA